MQMCISMLLIIETPLEYSFVGLVILTLLMNIVHSTKLFPQLSRHVTGFCLYLGKM